MNKLLLSTTTTILICIGAMLLVATVVIIFFKFRKTEKKDDISSKENDSFFRLEKNTQYLTKKEIKFYYLLHKILPAQFIAFPKVGVDNLCSPVGNRIDYNKITSKYVDFVIFEEATMTPLLVVDTFDLSYKDEGIANSQPNILKALQAINLPLVGFMIKDEYKEEEIKKQIFDILLPSKNENKE